MRLALFAVALLAPGSAWAASGSVDCVAARMGPVALQRIGDSIVRAIDVNGDSARALDADRGAVLAAREACRAAGNWSFDAIAAAIFYFQARATRLGVEAALRRDGIDPAPLATRYAALGAADRRSLLNRASPAVLHAIAAVSPRAAVRRHVFAYFTALAGLEIYAEDFAAA